MTLRVAIAAVLWGGLAGLVAGLWLTFGVSSPPKTCLALTRNIVVAPGGAIFEGFTVVVGEDVWVSGVQGPPFPDFPPTSPVVVERPSQEMLGLIVFRCEERTIEYGEEENGQTEDESGVGGAGRTTLRPG